MASNLVPIAFEQDLWRLILAALLILAFVVEAWLQVRRPNRVPGLALLVALRGLGIVAVAVLMLEPSVVRRSEQAAAPQSLILLDDSASMNVRDATPKRPPKLRFERAQALLSGAPTDLELRRFGDQLQSLEGPPYASAPAQSHSRLDLALLGLSQSSLYLDGVLVLSDGVLAKDPAQQQALKLAIDKLQVPVSLISVAGQTRRDLALTNPAIPEFAFAQNATQFRATLTREGITQRDFEVQLWKDEELVETQQISFHKTSREAEVKFRHVPTQLGTFVYRIKVPPAEDAEPEATLVNNEVYRVVRVLRDKVRVLHVAGRPDWDVRSLRTLLKRNPNVELLSYYILRDEEDQMRDDPSAPMSLIQFPHRELFEEQLGSFDLIILQNFDASARANYNENFSQYVLDGGAIVVIGGDLGLCTGDYSSPPFSQLLPVRPAIEAMKPGPIYAQLTEDGQAHPITAWLQSLMGPASRGLPPLDGLNPSQLPLRGHDNAKILIETKAPLQGTPMPILAVATPGKGRILELFTGSIWRWGFAYDLDLLQGLRPYDKLWQEIIRWSLHEDPKGLTAKLSQTLLTPGQPLKIQVQTRSQDGKAEGEVPVQLSWQDQGKPHTQSLRSDAKGQANLEIKLQGPGLVRLEFSRKVAGQEPVRLNKMVVVGSASDELSALDPDPYEASLRALIEDSGGKYARVPSMLDASSRDLRDFMVTRAPSIERALAGGQAQRELLWSHPLSWLAALALALEWWLRRRQGKV